MLEPEAKYFFIHTHTKKGVSTLKEKGFPT